MNNLISVVTLHATVMASGSLAYFVGCGVASKDCNQVLATSRSVWCLQRPQVMLSWCCGIADILVIYVSMLTFRRSQIQAHFDTWM